MDAALEQMRRTALAEREQAVQQALRVGNEAIQEVQRHAALAQRTAVQEALRAERATHEARVQQLTTRFTAAAMEEQRDTVRLALAQVWAPPLCLTFGPHRGGQLIRLCGPARPATPTLGRRRYLAVVYAAASSPLWLNEQRFHLVIAFPTSPPEPQLLLHGQLPQRSYAPRAPTHRRRSTVRRRCAPPRSGARTRERCQPQSQPRGHLYPHPYPYPHPHPHLHRRRYTRLHPPPTHRFQPFSMRCCRSPKWHLRLLRQRRNSPFLRTTRTARHRACSRP